MSTVETSRDINGKQESRDSLEDRRAEGKITLKRSLKIRRYVLDLFGSEWSRW
jgi:hypothetical protein